MQKLQKQFFQDKIPVTINEENCFLAKGRKIIELPYELHHVFCYDDSLPTYDDSPSHTALHCTVPYTEIHVN